MSPGTAIKTPKAPHTRSSTVSPGILCSLKNIKKENTYGIFVSPGNTHPTTNPQGLPATSPAASSSQKFSCGIKKDTTTLVSMLGDKRPPRGSRSNTMKRFHNPSPLKDTEKANVAGNKAIHKYFQSHTLPNSSSIL